MKGQMVEQPGQEPKERREDQPYVQLTQSEQKKYREHQFMHLFQDKAAMLSGSQIARSLGMSPKRVYKLIQRVRKNGTLTPKKRGKKRKVTPEMIEFLVQWFKAGDNVGKSFKYAYEALVKESGLFKKELVKGRGRDQTMAQVKAVSPVSMHGCYKAFKRYSDFTYKRVQRIKIKSNTASNKLKRVQFLQRFLPYHAAEDRGECEIIFLDEAGFNLDKQGASYAWGEIGK
jgi:transposase